MAIWSVLLMIFCSALCLQAQPYASLGVLQHKNRWEMGLTFAGNLDESSITDPANYQLSAGMIESIRFLTQNRAVVLVSSSFDPGQQYTLTLDGIRNKDGNRLAKLDLAFVARDFAWAAIGGQEFGFIPDAVAVENSGFDLISGGSQLWDRYDEATFVYQAVTGDFVAVVRVAHQDASSRWARAGLMVRESLDEDRARPADPFDPNQAFSRYISVHVNPVQMADGNPANNSHEVNFRPFKGGIGSPNFDPTENPPLVNNAAPSYPNAWLRIQRAGQLFTVARSADGVQWHEMGSFSFPTKDVNGNDVPPFSNTVFVGPHYSPENGNIPPASGLRAAFLAQFRDYSVASNPEPPKISVRKIGNQVEVSWTGGGVLQAKDKLESGQWTDIQEASTPYLSAPSGARRYYRVKR